MVRAGVALTAETIGNSASGLTGCAALAYSTILNDMDTSSEEYRHQCEVRYYLVKRHKEGREAVVKAVELTGKKRGEAAAKRLMQDIVHQWSLGNRGEHKDWRED